MLHELGYAPATFTNSVDVLAYVHTGAAVDVCILDIVMPEMSGIDLAQKLREAGFAGEIVFLSASNEYGPQTYDVKAFHYLIKPPSLDSVRRVLDDIQVKREKADRAGMQLKVTGSMRFLQFRDVEYVEVIKNYVNFHLLAGESVAIRSTLAEITPQLLCDSRFIQCHQSFIVNMDAIASITSREITTCSGAKIPVSKSYPDTKMKYLDRGLRGERV